VSGLAVWEERGEICEIKRRRKRRRRRR